MSLADLEPANPVELVPALPRPGQRWTVRRKATVIGAVRGGYVPIEEACSLYNISVDEFLAWERAMDRNGIPGLRSTRFQIYRDTDKQRRRGRMLEATMFIVVGAIIMIVGVARWRWRGACLLGNSRVGFFYREK